MYPKLNLKIAEFFFVPVVVTTLLISTAVMTTATTPRRIYDPIPLQIDKQITDTLSNQDIPTGQGGFARDYIMNLKAGDQVVLEAKSSDFDTIITLLYFDGSTVGENDDGPDGTTNSLLFARILKSGDYIVRVQGFGGEAAKGAFSLKVTKLRPQ